jgi:hypothetical protein
VVRGDCAASWLAPVVGDPAAGRAESGIAPCRRERLATVITIPERDRLPFPGALLTHGGGSECVEALLAATLLPAFEQPTTVQDFQSTTRAGYRDRVNRCEFAGDTGLCRLVPMELWDALVHAQFRVIGRVDTCQ